MELSVQVQADVGDAVCRWRPAATLPLSGWLSSGEAAIADPTTVVGGQALARKAAGSQLLASRFGSATRSLEGTATCALTSPASSRSWSIEVVTVVGIRPGPV